VLGNNLDIATLAKEYESGGAIGISVLTEPNYFGGSLENLAKVKASVALPVLRKDFIIDKYQVHESVAHDADSILLIVSCLGDKLQDFLALTYELGLEALVECHSSQEVEEALEAGARIIGINNRDLETMKVDLTRTEELAPGVPDDVITVSESGIRGPDDVKRALEAGADVVLIGTALMRSGDVRRKVQSLVNAR
jgi:indole-3-glycerol phosphate synthase